MKESLLLIVFATSILACHNPKDNASQMLPKQYEKCVGEQVSLEFANRWVQNFSGSIGAGREQSHYSVSASTLAQLLSVNEGPGVVLHHATDDTATHHILMSTLRADGELLASNVLDLSSGAMINPATAKIWTQNYADAHPATPWYHFFGNDIFSEIQSNNAFDYVSVERALNEDNEEQVLLFVYNTRNIVAGSTEEEEIVVYDISSSWPPCSIN